MVENIRLYANDYYGLWTVYDLENALRVSFRAT